MPTYFSIHNFESLLDILSLCIASFGNDIYDGGFVSTYVGVYQTCHTAILKHMYRTTYTGVHERLVLNTNSL